MKLKTRHRWRFFLSAGLCAGAVLASPMVAVAQPDAPNPPWPARCPVKLGLLIDRSSSMSSRFGDVRDAARNVVDSLRDKRSEVTIVGFGTGAEVISSAVDVSNSDDRHRLKDQIDGLDVLGGDSSATNWQAALTSVAALHLDVVVLLTDGLPNVYGNPVQEGPEALSAAVTAANQLKGSGTRLAAVGIDLQQDSEQNLRSVTGPVAGQDYYSSDTAGLLHQLYGIVASACGVPAELLPKPEPAVFPWGKVILWTLGGLLLVGLVGFGLARRRHTAIGAGPAGRSGGKVAANPTIDHDHLTRQLRDDNPTPPTSKDRP